MQKNALYLLLILALGSCIPAEKLKYAIDTPESKDKFYNDMGEKTIQPFDYLYIRIYSLDEATSRIFNAETSYGQSNENLQSYAVTDKGEITFPFIGNIFVKDLTLEEARIKLEKELNKYLTNVSIRIRFVANKITIVGEVNHPGNYTFYDEKINVFQALGLAGDIANYGDKTKVALVREKDDNINYQYLDLTSKSIVESDYYYLLPNDILIVDPVKAKYRMLQDRNMVYLIVSTVTSLGTLAVSTVALINSLQ
jgi:polysaccharide export outer membrane protein